MNLATLLILIALGCLWYLYAFLYRDYRVDLLRHRLFAIRRRLFQVVSEHEELDHNHEAHVQFRALINAMIRFAHRITFFQVVMLSLFRNSVKVDDNFSHELEESYSQLPNDVQKEFKNFQRQFAIILVDHIVHISIALVWLVPLLWIIRVVGESTKTARRWRRRARRFAYGLPGIAAVEKQALDSLENERLRRAA